MCGLAGIVSANSSHVTPGVIRAATETLIHRGPEAEGIWIAPSQNAGFGHRRLCIIDRSDEASQPMRYMDRYTIIHNGELFNYLEIKKDLAKKGFQFRTASDTEVIVAAFAAWGKECLQQFEGMFAFAIWDEERQSLFAARDRFGEKPFFFFYDEERLVFASEIKALWSMNVSKEINHGMLYNFLNIGYTTNPSDPQETFYANIRKLPAASFLTYSPASAELMVEQYWQVSISVDSNISEQQARSRFKTLFNESINLRLRSDVSIGTSLSGGLDSSAVVAFCDQQVAEQYTHQCFTATFHGYEKNEDRYASMVANRFRLQHYKVEISEHEIPELMQKAAAAQDEPFSSASVLAQFSVYELARENGVTVLLDGQGADEVLAGYHKYYKWYWQQLYRERKLAKSKELQYARELGIRETFGLKNRVAAMVPEFAAGLQQGRKEKQAYRNPDIARDFAFSNKRNLYYATPATFDLNGALYFNSFVNGLEELLRLADRNSMAHSVEVRLPFLSHPLVEFLFTLPPHFKIRQGWTKWLLRKSVENLLPEEITWRRDKTGFEPPQKKWMQNKMVQEQITEAKSELVRQHVLDNEVMKKPVQPKDAHENESFDWRYWSASYLYK